MLVSPRFFPKLVTKRWRKWRVVWAMALVVNRARLFDCRCLGSMMEWQRGWAMVMGMSDWNMVLRLVMRVVNALWAMVEACLSLGKGLFFVVNRKGAKWSQSFGCVRGLKEMHVWGGVYCDDGSGMRGAV